MAHIAPCLSRTRACACTHVFVPHACVCRCVLHMYVRAHVRVRVCACLGTERTCFQGEARCLACRVDSSTAHYKELRVGVLAGFRDMLSQRRLNVPVLSDSCFWGPGPVTSHCVSE